MKSGKLRHPVIIESFADAQDSAGQPIQTWAFFADRKASVEPVDPIRTPSFRGDERFEPEIYKISFRFLPGLDKTMRVRFGSIIFEILNIAPDAKTFRREQVLTCRTGFDSNG